MLGIFVENNFFIFSSHQIRKYSSLYSNNSSQDKIKKRIVAKQDSFVVSLQITQ